ncbi:hypothetical protein [Rhodococcus pyridinivorans]|uniref:Uncharacterized protein n=1 Tax=Rhodococcus pyridinivorans TaxID=103816 RepID=A0A7M2XSY8_9NOCA|nr:hypothetical protein [Rhodococcus pyridinivorans]QOW00493.1 hypothetical protein INP59_09315 [Rhodococcus pyridinivorans]
MIVTLAQAANDDAAAAAGTQWWPGALVPIGVVVAALIAGYFGGRNARKTPHEKLAALADIYDKLGKRPDTFPTQFETLEAAIAHEVENIEKLRKAAEQGRIAYIEERFRLAFSADGALGSVLGAVVPAALATLLAVAVNAFLS